MERGLKCGPPSISRSMSDELVASPRVRAEHKSALQAVPLKKRRNDRAQLIACENAAHAPPS